MAYQVYKSFVQKGTGGRRIKRSIQKENKNEKKLEKIE